MAAKETITLLLVDDTPDNLFTLRQVIADHLPQRCEILTATNGKEGLSIAAKTALDGALIDVQMPRVDGIEMCRRLRDDPATANVPVILMTAHGADATVKARGLDAGAMDFIRKPIDNAELIARIRVMLRVKLAEDALRDTNEELERRVRERTKQLAESELYYRTLIYNLHEDILVIDRDYRITDVNNTATLTLGLKREDVIGRHCYEVSHGIDAPCHERGEQCGLRTAFDTGKPCHIQHEHAAADGKKVYVDLLMSPLTSADGTVTHVVEAARDITELVQAQEGLRQYEHIVSSTTDMLALVDKRYVYIAANAAYLRALAKTSDEVIGRTVAEVFGEDFFSKVIRPRADRCLAGEDIRHEAWFDFPATGRSYMDVSYSPYRGQGAEVRGFVVAARDITDRNLLQEQYLQAQKMEAIGQLAGGVAHDFRNQLTVIQGYAAMLLRRSLVTEEGRSRVEEILKAAERSTTITNQLLVFSRRESLRPETVALGDSVQELSKLLPQMLGEDIRLLIVPSLEACLADIDPGLFQQAIMNLVVNARHAMPDGGELTIETYRSEMDRETRLNHPDARAGTYAVIAVTDTGTGMDAKTLAKIFDPFFTTKEVGVGTGMGLAMVHGFVGQSDGFIQVDSESGKGSTFRLYFPLASNAKKPTDAAPTTEPGTLPQGTETLLVVEDEEAVRHLAVSALREWGYKVLQAANATEALPLGEHYEDKIDLLVTDVVMPKMDGVELAKRLRSVRPDMSVLFISGYTKDVADEKGLLGLGTELLLKPFDNIALARAVRRLLDRALPAPRQGA